MLALLPRHALALEWEREQLQRALELLSCDEGGDEGGDEGQARTLLLSCLEEAAEELVGGKAAAEDGSGQRALRNLLLQLTRERRPGDEDFDARDGCSGAA